jgi:hypothetical protein
MAPKPIRRIGTVKDGPLQLAMTIGGLALSLRRHPSNMRCRPVRMAAFQVRQSTIRISHQIDHEIASRMDMGLIIAIAQLIRVTTSEVVRMTPPDHEAGTALRSPCLHPDPAAISLANQPGQTAKPMTDRAGWPGIPGPAVGFKNGVTEVLIPVKALWIEPGWDPRTSKVLRRARAHQTVVLGLHSQRQIAWTDKNVRDQRESPAVGTTTRGIELLLTLALRGIHPQDVTTSRRVALREQRIVQLRPILRIGRPIIHLPGIAEMNIRLPALDRIVGRTADESCLPRQIHAAGMTTYLQYGSSKIPIMAG